MFLKLCIKIIGTLNFPVKPKILREETTKYWRDIGRAQIERAKAKMPRENRAKNGILFIGDGMGIQTQTAGRILVNGEAHDTHLDNMDYTGLVKTYNVDYQTPDSSATATAYHAGVKARYGTVGVNAGADRDTCGSVFGNEVETMLEKARRAGKSVGFVTNTYVVHASPASFYAKLNTRSWYSDSRMMVDGVMPDDRKERG